MTRWHRTRRGDLAIRVAGLGACALSCACIRHLLHLHDVNPAHWRPGAAIYFLTATGFLLGSAGSAMLLLGMHLFDEVRVSERWRVKRPDGRGAGVSGSAGIWSVVEAPLPDDASVPRRNRLPGTRQAGGSFMRPTESSIHMFRRAEDRGGRVLAMMMPISGRVR